MSENERRILWGLLIAVIIVVVAIGVVIDQNNQQAREAQRLLNEAILRGN